jgi:hypothetical protein
MTIFFLSLTSPLVSVSVLSSEFVGLIFLQVHRETDSFFTDSGVQLAQSTSGQFHYRRTAFSSHLKSKIRNILAKTVALRIVLKIDGASIVSRSHTHPSHIPHLWLLVSHYTDTHIYVFSC